MENSQKFENGINQAINAAAKGDINQFQSGFNVAVEARIADKSKALIQDALVRQGVYMRKDP